MASRPLILGLLLAGGLTGAVAQWINHPAPGIPRTKDGKPNLSAPTPRAPNGKPDLAGLWQMEPPKPGEIERLFAGAPDLLYAVPGDDLRELHRFFVNILVDFKPGEVTVLPQAAARNDGIPPACPPPTIPNAYFVPLPFRIVQTPQLLVMLFEGEHVFRQIHTDGRKHPVDPQPSWLGYSTGRWEDRTLVVDTVGFNDKSPLDIFGHPRSESLHLTEKFFRRDFGHMEVELTIDDPKNYNKPFTVRFNEILTPDTEILEYFCTENEKDQVHLRK